MLYKVLFIKQKSETTNKYQIIKNEGLGVELSERADVRQSSAHLLLFFHSYKCLVLKFFFISKGAESATL